MTDAMKSLNPFGDESYEEEVNLPKQQQQLEKKPIPPPSLPPTATTATVYNTSTGSRYEPVAKYGHCTVTVNDKSYMWGGWQKGFPEVHTSNEKMALTSAVDIFDLQKGEWRKIDTYGTPPLGVRGYSCTTIDNCIYYFGGYCGHEWCRHCSLHLLDTATLQWRELPVENPHQSPMKKNASGMVSFNENNDDYLLVFGGVGMLATANQPEAIYIPWKDNPNYGWTNEVHIYSLKTANWLTPTMKGERPPPCAGFTLTKITPNSALLYGGIDATTGRCLEDTYIIEMSTDTIHWHKLPLIQGQRKPANRHDHAAVCISGPLFGQIKPMVLISGGRDTKWQSLGDLWLLDCSNGSWKQCEVPLSAAQRHFHSISVFPLSNYCLYAVIFGGIKEWLQAEPPGGQPMLSDTTVLEICLKDDDSSWEVCAVLNSEMLRSTEEYKNRLVKRLFQVINTQPSDGAHQQELIRLRSELEQTQLKLKVAQEKITSLEQEIAENKTRPKQQDTISHASTDDSSLSLPLPPPLPPPPPLSISASGSHINAEEIAIEMTGDALKPHLISRQDITLTGPDIDVGGYGRTVLAKYRERLQVTAKVLSTPQSPSQSTPFSQMVLNHKLVQSFQLRHPNIVQLLFVCKEREVVVVTEATPLTLRHHLDTKQLGKQDIINILTDVATGISFLHSHNPYPIIHRGLSSKGIILEHSANGKFKGKIIDFLTSNYFYQTCPEMPFIIDPVYVPPNPSSSDTKFDIFSFGIIVLETITRKLPPEDATKKERILTTIKWPPVVSLIRDCIKEEGSKRPTADEILTTLYNL